MHSEQLKENLEILSREINVGKARWLNLIDTDAVRYFSAEPQNSAETAFRILYALDEMMNNPRIRILADMCPQFEHTNPLPPAHLIIDYDAMRYIEGTVFIESTYDPNRYGADSFSERNLPHDLIKALILSYFDTHSAQTIDPNPESDYDLGGFSLGYSTLHFWKASNKDLQTKAAVADVLGFVMDIDTSERYTIRVTTEGDPNDQIYQEGISLFKTNEIEGVRQFLAIKNLNPEQVLHRYEADHALDAKEPYPTLIRWNKSTSGERYAYPRRPIFFTHTHHMFFSKRLGEKYGFDIDTHLPSIAGYFTNDIELLLALNFNETPTIDSLALTVLDGTHQDIRTLFYQHVFETYLRHRWKEGGLDLVNTYEDELQPAIDGYRRYEAVDTSFPGDSDNYRLILQERQGRYFLAVPQTAIVGDEFEVHLLFTAEYINSIIDAQIQAIDVSINTLRKRKRNLRSYKRAESTSG